MSVRFHEAVSFDSTKYRLDERDDFWGDSLDARWGLTVVGTGAGAVVDAQDGGVYRLRVPAASDQSYIKWSDIRSLHVNKKVAIEARVKAVNGTTTNTFRYLNRLIFDTSNEIRFYHNYNSSDIYISCINGGASTALDSGINIDSDFHVYRIETSTTAVHFYIDNVETSNSPIITNIPSDAGDYLQPFVGIFGNASLAAETQLDTDYIYVRQNR